MGDMENEKRYEELSEYTYFDNETDEVVLVLSDEESEAIERILEEQEKLDG